MCACACTYLCVMYVDAFLTFLSLCAVSEGCDTGSMTPTEYIHMYTPTYCSAFHYYYVCHCNIIKIKTTPEILSFDTHIFVILLDSASVIAESDTVFLFSSSPFHSLCLLLQLLGC